MSENRETINQKLGEIEGTNMDDKQIILSIRTGLMSKDNSYRVNVPKKYENSTVMELLGYALSLEAEEEDKSTVHSVKGILDSENKVIVLNNRTVKMTESVKPYYVDAEHVLSNDEVLHYRSLDFEVSSIQQGGF